MHGTCDVLLKSILHCKIFYIIYICKIIIVAEKYTLYQKIILNKGNILTQSATQQLIYKI